MPFLSPGDLPGPGIEPRSPTLQADSLLFEPPEKQVVMPKTQSLCTGAKLDLRDAVFGEVDKNVQYWWSSGEHSCLPGN